MTKNKPKQNTTGKGKRANKGRGGCETPKSEGQGRNPKRK